MTAGPVMSTDFLLQLFKVRNRHHSCGHDRTCCHLSISLRQDGVHGVGNLYTQSPFSVTFRLDSGTASFGLISHFVISLC